MNNFSLLPLGETPYTIIKEKESFIDIQEISFKIKELIFYNPSILTQKELHLLFALGVSFAISTP